MVPCIVAMRKMSGMIKYKMIKKLLIVIVFFGFSCQQRGTSDDMVVFVVEQKIRDIDPRFSLTSYDVKLSRLIAPGLTSVDTKNSEPRLELAQSIHKITDLKWRVLLRDNLRFSDGTVLTAHDVAFTFQSVMDPATKSLYRKGFIDRFVSVKAIDDNQVEFHLKQPLATLLSDLDFGIISKNNMAQNHVIGAGPYQLKSRKQDVVVFQSNPYYYGQTPKTKKVMFRFVQDTNARLLVLVGGDADITQNSVRLDLLSSVKMQSDLKITSSNSSILTYLMMNNHDPILSNPKVRQAIAYSIDRKRIIQTKLHGYASEATGLLPAMHWAYNGNVAGYNYNPQLAQQLLDEAGYPYGEGKKLRFTLNYKTSSNPFRRSIAQVIAEQLQLVGIKVDIRSYEFGVFFDDIKQGNFQLASMQTATITEPDYYYAYFHSERIPTSKNPGLMNRWKYSNTKLDDLVSQARQMSNRKQRIKLYGEVQQILATDLPIIPLWHEDNIAVSRLNIHGYQLLPNARFYGLISTYKSAL